ncbi:5-formyltetrahydrofolate cyclo-ligase [Clostridium rectalis]|uniref:5-formyltetrahydrofolate cyclo-ligase n=1 Tax=Clostridium rectalis TaxID=2040295 RepID=UPI000F62DCE0|nr:5-formyltetrahydrofolate cyclo-ligase [Clostridium rectalis]
MLDKKSLRKQVLEKRDALTYKERGYLDKEIFNKLIQSNFYKNSNCIFVFVSYKTEVDTHLIIKKALQDGKTVCVPKVISKEKGMVAVKIKDFSELLVSTYGILEPKICNNLVNPKEIDLVLLPGAVFDGNGGRIGYGGGFYDRFLVNVKPSVSKIGLAYKIQVVKKVPMDELDIRIDGIITNG